MGEVGGNQIVHGCSSIISSRTTFFTFIYHPCGQGVRSRSNAFSFNGLAGWVCDFWAPLIQLLSRYLIRIRSQYKCRVPLRSHRGHIHLGPACCAGPISGCHRYSDGTIYSFFVGIGAIFSSNGISDQTHFSSFVYSSSWKTLPFALSLLSTVRFTFCPSSHNP